MTVHTSSSPISLREWVSRGLNFQRRGQASTAMACYEQALSLEPGNPDVQQLYGVALLAKGYHVRAAQALSAAAALLPTFAPVHLNLGLALHQTKDYDGAITAFQKAVDLDPSLKIAYRNMANTRMDQGLFEEAVKLYEQYHSGTPGDVQIWPNMIQCHIRLGSKAGAVTAASRAIRAGANDLNFWEHVVDIYREFGPYEHMLHMYSYIASRWPDAADAAQNLAIEALQHEDLVIGWHLYGARFHAKRPQGT